MKIQFFFCNSFDLTNVFPYFQVLNSYNVLTKNCLADASPLHTRKYMRVTADNEDGLNAFLAILKKILYQ